MTKEQSPTYSEIQDRLRLVARRHSDVARLEEVGASGLGKTLTAVRLTDRSVRGDDKQHVLVVGGQHGNEESGRAVAMALVEWLCGAGRRLLGWHEIAVMPIVNPDGSELDIYGTPAGVKPNADHAPSGPKIPEAVALERLSYSLEPEVFVDLHSRGHAGCSHDMVLYPGPQPYTSDHIVLQGLADEMAAASQGRGTPTVVHPLSWPGWTGNDDLAGPSSTTFHYRQFKSIVLLTENAEHNEHSYPMRQRLAAGLARLRTLLAYGGRRFAGMHESGYPAGMTIGMFHLGLAAAGRTMRERRASRVAIWRQKAKFDRLGVEMPEKLREKTVVLEYSGPALPVKAAVQAQVSGRVRPRRVVVDGRSIRPATGCRGGEHRGMSSGYCFWHESATTYVLAVLPEVRQGKIVVELQCE